MCLSIETSHSLKKTTHSLVQGSKDVYIWKDALAERASSKRRETTSGNERFRSLRPSAKEPFRYILIPALALLLLHALHLSAALIVSVCVGTHVSDHLCFTCWS
jgi:hypothetical protein